jgi:uncharacterized spore protein YtfJ
MGAALACLILVSTALSGPAVGPGPKTPEPQALSSTAAESPVSLALKSMLNLVLKDFHVQKVVGEPIRAGNVTIIPVMLVDVGFGGGAGGGTGPSFPVGSGFYLGGEAKPLGFIVISRSGTKFLSAGPAPRD